MVDTKYGQRKVTNITLADASDGIDLQAWGSPVKEQLQEENCYRITDLIVKVYDDKKYLNTTSNSRVTAIPDMPDIVNKTVETRETFKNMTVTSIQITSKRSCSVCSKAIETEPNENLITIRCLSCNFKQKIQDLPVKVQATIYLNSEEGVQKKIQANNHVLTNFLKTNDKLHLIRNTDAFEDFIIGQSVFDLLLDSGNLISIEPVIRMSSV